jgi:hypothetical protein
MAEAVFQHVRVSGKKFERSSIVLDNMWIESCPYEDCDVFYSGGPVEARSCRFEHELEFDYRQVKEQPLTTVGEA